MAARAHILVVDDEEPIRQLASLYLEKEGYRVTCAADGPEALELAQSQSPALPGTPRRSHRVDEEWESLGRLGGYIAWAVGG